MNDNIIIKGAKEHNLKNIDLTIPRNKLVVVTGLSGSGKSSLAFDTLYAEGQRRYVESLSSYARQFLGMMEKPEVESIEGLSPAISIDQKTTSKNPRSTVGTVTEIYDYLRLLYARIGVPYCPNCGKKIEKQTIDQIVDNILELEEGTRLQVLAPVVRGRKGEFTKQLEDYQKAGFIRVRIDGQMYELGEDEITLDKKKKHNVDVVVDRLIIKEGIRARLTESVETAMKYANNLVTIDVPGQEEKIYSQNYACTDCGISFEELTPRMFSFNNPFGACPECTGIGYLMRIDEDLIIPDKDKTLYDGVKAFGASTMKKGDTMAKMYFESIAKHYGVKIKDVPIKKLPKDFLNKILYGTGDEVIDFEYTSAAGTRKFSTPFEGVIPTLERRHNETKSNGMRSFYEMYMSESPCLACHGARLRKESLSVKIGELNIKELTDMSIDKIKEYIKNNKIIFVTGTTGALFAHNIDRLDGSSFNGLNLLDMDVKERNMVLGDDLYYKFEKMEIMSSQIQMIDITLNKAKEFGKIIYGYGNNGKNEGARNKNLLFTNALGPVLVKNPWLTEYLINLALKNKGLKEINKKIDFDLELKSLESAKEFINKKIEKERGNE